MKQSRQTTIYWLIDTRTSAPFYCGKTVTSTKRRLTSHLSEAKRYPQRKLHARLHDCGENIEIKTIEVIPPGGDWIEREQHWIRVLRSQVSDACNIADGGQGCTGWTPPPEWCAKISRLRKGATFSAATRAKLSAANKGRIPSAVTMLRAKEVNTGGQHSSAHREKISRAIKERWNSPGYKERLAKAQTGKRASEETRAKLKAAWVIRHQNKATVGANV